MSTGPSTSSTSSTSTTSFTSSSDALKALPLPQQLLHWAAQRPDAVALRQKEYGVWQPITWSAYAQQARWFGLGLLQLGLLPGQAVAVLSENRKEWVFAQLGAALVRGVTAGVYPTSPAPEIEHLLTLSDAPVIVCEDQEQLDKVLSIRERLPHLRTIVLIDSRGLRRYDRTGMVDFDEVIALGRKFEADQPAAAAAATVGPELDDIGLIVFTSGSTGRPKAAMMSWRGLGTAARGLNSVLGCREGDSLVSYLPLCHMGEQMFSLHIPVAFGAVVNFAESLRTVQDDLRELSPRIFFGVPRIWEKFHASIQNKLREAGGLRLWLYERAMHSLAHDAAVPRARWNWLQRARWAVWYVLILRSLLNYLGLRRCRVAVSAAAPIAPEVLRFFRVLGVPIREAYGMTEASGATTMQPGDDSPVGTVGVPYPGVEVQLADDGEILVRGEVVFRGYLKNEDATREAIDAEGWLHTGDIGRWDDAPAGRELRIVDRKKDIMITAGGKNITPSEIENAMRFSPFIKEAVAIADRRHFVSALIQIDFETVSKWSEEKGLVYTTFRSLVELPQVRELVQREVDTANARMPQVQQVRKFHLLTKELDHDDGEVTATMKVRRKAVFEKYAQVIEEIYV
ncbi:MULTISPECIES: long-chain fatty acid--CoA ligase [unclassified Variovorax]|uniref:AMP-dependent synthetase/ligase n=1 Tax=unclassified Variovorax TaxID=663243 RepID=UPI0008CEFAE8|nr:MULTISPECIES: AMP-binding protein [unclassified Variovorax]SEK16708.1 long-chain acyl-CoA synthetase [Variovorax sp. OK202]SFE55999.1 long-chain acyl-CoA synthetase [Variovorax sp. OK212]